MVKKISLNVKLRDKKNKANKLRRSGYVPAIVYGDETENKNIQIKNNDLVNAYESAGESTLIDLDVEGGEKISTIIKEVQWDPVKNKMIHADFFKVNMKEKLDVEIPLEFINESKAVKELGGTLVRNMESLEARCLPNDLIDRIEVDISSLLSFEDAIYVKDLKIPDKIEVLSQPEDVVANISAPAEEEVEQAPAEVTDEAEKKPEEQKEAEETKDK